MICKPLRSVCALLLCAVLVTPALAAEPEEQEETDPGQLTWETLEERIRSGSLTAQVLDERIQSVEAVDYEEMYEQLRNQLNSLADAQWYMIMMGEDDAADQLGQTSVALRDTFESIKDGEMQEDNADAVRQLEDAVNQIVAGGETLYLTLLELEQTRADAGRGLAALDRSLEELRLRRDLGQVSDQQVAELAETRRETESQLRTLDNGISSAQAQLRALTGVSPEEELTLAPLPEETDRDWSALDFEADLAAAKEASWSLRSADLTLEDAREQWKDDRQNYYGSYYRYQYEVAEHTWNAAQVAHQASVEEFETAFRTLYDSLADYEQILESREAAVVYQQTLLDAARVRYDLGQASYSSVLTAEDNLSAAQSAAESARRDLFAARNNYCHAVEWGLLPATAA